MHPYQTRDLFSTYGKTTRFSESFNNMMFQDNSLWAASRLQQRLTHGNHFREAKMERERAKLQSLLDRRALATHYKEKYGIKVDSRTIERLTEKQLLIKLETRCQIAKENQAAIKIQSVARVLICKNRFNKLQEARQKAALRI